MDICRGGTVNIFVEGRSRCPGCRQRGRLKGFMELVQADVQIVDGTEGAGLKETLENSVKSRAKEHSKRDTETWHDKKTLKPL